MRAVLPLLLASATAAAEPAEHVPAPTAAVQDGAVLPLARGLPGGDATVRVDGGYDGAAKHATGGASAIVRIWREVSVIGGAQYTSSGALRPFGGAAVRIRDVALSAVYRAEGLTEPEGELELGVDATHQLGIASLIGGATYGQDLDARERDAEEQLSTVIRLGDRWWIGAGERARVSLATPPAGEASWDLAAGPHASVDAGPVVVTAFAGVAARDLDGSTTAGVAGSLGVARRF